MTRKVYRTAMGKDIDLGALLLQNESVRAVGNMNVNARGDILGANNQVIDPKNRQVQRQYQRTVTNVTDEAQVHTSTVSAKAAASRASAESTVDTTSLDVTGPVDLFPVEAPPPVTDDPSVPITGGLAAAIARSRTIKQEKEKTLREQQQAQGIRKI